MQKHQDDIVILKGGRNMKRFKDPSEFASFYDPSCLEEHMYFDHCEHDIEMVKDSFQDFYSCIEHGDLDLAAKYLCRIADILDFPFSKETFLNEMRPEGLSEKNHKTRRSLYYEKH